MTTPTIRRALTASLRAEIEALREAVRDIHPTLCHDCFGSGLAGDEGSCESCYGHEDRRGDGWLPNGDVDLSEWTSRPAVRRALDQQQPTEPEGRTNEQ